MKWITTAVYRIAIATFGFLWSITMGTLSAVMDSVNVDSAIILSVIGFSSGLLGVGLLKRRDHNGSESPFIEGIEN